jgi:RNA polymerase sigma factor (TIGR02999 family)
MSHPAEQDVTALLGEWSGGDREALERLIPVVYGELRRLAASYAVAARMMRRILVDHARKRRASKRDAEAWLIEGAAGASVASGRPTELLSLDRALECRERIDPAQARVVELRFFGGLTIEETAEASGVSPATVKREWQTARAWLRREMGLTA